VPQLRRLKRVLSGRWRLQTLVGLVMIPVSLIPLYFFLTETETGRLIVLRARYEVSTPTTPTLDRGESALARSYRTTRIVGVPVLVYHGIGQEETSDPGPETMVVSRQRFAEHMRGLRAAGYSAITADDLADYLASGDAGALPTRPILITFDDGRTDATLQADPILEDTGLRATMFVIGEQGDRPTIFHEDWDALAEYAASGRWELEHHTNALHDCSNAPGITALVERRPGESLDEYAERVATDLDAGAASLRDHGAGRLTAFAYPCGDWGQYAGRAVAETLRRVLTPRFEIAFDQANPARWRPALPGDDPLRVHRLQVGRWSLAELLRRLEEGAERSAAAARAHVTAPGI
jgi:peptidoglycan/xylan/chitin deacetylase (PgdA/CDA1 family)